MEKGQINIKVSDGFHQIITKEIDKAGIAIQDLIPLLIDSKWMLERKIP